MNTFTGPFTEQEQAQLTEVVRPFAAAWCFVKEQRPRSVVYQASQPCWDNISIGGKSPRPYEARTVAELAGRLGLLAMGKNLVKGTNDERETDSI